MNGSPQRIVRRAGIEDAGAVARLLYDFNTEYDEPVPHPDALAPRLRELMEAEEILVLLGGSGPDGLVLMRFRPTLLTKGLDSYVEEVYVVPHLRGRGLGRAMMEAAIDIARERGAIHMDLGTSEDDVPARALYERLGFDRHEGKPDGPVMYYYERDL
jgi:ribosomal protein S18 acetylase RimI-like enzyme